MANRYSNYTPSAYNPLSLEEIAMVPAMRRKQHDALLAQQELIKSGLAKVDPYKKHFDEAINLKQGIESKIDQTATELAEQGVNNDMIGKTIALNREFQDLTSPTGKLGQINAEKINIAKINEEYDKMAAAQKWSPAESDYWKNKAITEYNDLKQNPVYDPETGRIKQYSGPAPAPTRVNYADKFHSYASNAKMSTSEFANAAQELAYDESTGQSAVKGSSYSKKWGDNTKAVLAAYQTMKREMQDPTSDVYKSMTYEQRQPANLLDTINKQKDIYKQTISAVESGNTINPGPKGDNDDTAGGDIITNDSTLKSDIAGHDNYTDALNEIKALNTKKNRTIQEEDRLSDLIELRRGADSKLVGNKTYEQIESKKKQAIDLVYNLGTKYKIPRREGISDRDYASYVEHSLPPGANKEDVAKAVTLRSNITKYDREYNKIKDDAWKNSSSMRHNYSYMPKTPKQESMWNLHNENVFNVMKGVPHLGNVLDLTSIKTAGGDRKDLNDEDVTNVHDLLKSGDPKSFKINNIKTYGDNRTPEITMTFNTMKGANGYDISSSTEGSGDEYGGEEKPVTVTFKMKRFSNAYDSGSAAGYKSLSGAIADFWKDKGGVNKITGNFQGSEVSNSLILNRYADVSDAELKKRAVVDEDAREALMIRTAQHQAKKR